VFDSGLLFDHIERLGHLGSFRWVVGGTAEWSLGLFRLLGFEPGEVTPSAEAFLQRVHPEDVMRLRERQLELLQRGAGSGEISFRVVLPSGNVRVLLGRTVIEQRAGDCVVLLGTITDITEELRSLRAIQEVEALLHEVQELTGVGHFALDADMKQVVRSAGLRKVIGVDDVVSRPHFERMHPEDLERGLAWLRAGLAGTVLEPLHFRVLDSDGTMRSLEARARLQHSETGLPRLLGTIIDTTERVLSEERRREIAKLEAIGTLAAGVAHDFNNFLTVVAGQLEIARAAGAPDGPMDAAAVAVRQCAQLTRQLLAFSRRQPSEARALDVGALLAGALPALRAALGPQVVVTIEPPSAPAIVRADPGQLESVVTNLAMNARDAMPNGGTLTLSVAVVQASAEGASDGVAPGRMVRLSVRDTGTGIAPDVLPRIFEPYFTTKAPGHGSGLGLASAYGTVRQHGGFIAVDSSTQGTTFHVHLPVSEATDVRAAPPCASENLDTLTVLVVDDVASVRELAALFLRAQGMRALTAESGAHALALVDIERVDVVLTDVIMPGLTGLELATALQARPGSPDVIFMTGYADQHELDRIPSPVVHKPFNADSLRAALQQWCATRRQR
jgi:two-component system, cell cycle sensor histidine kinase and response regulator CckA